MAQYSIRDKCHINTNFETDTFVGIKFEDGDYSVNFPIGYRLSDDEHDLRKDILLLLHVLSTHTNRKESKKINYTIDLDTLGFPLQSYLYMISDYYKRGYYKEHEKQFHHAIHGKIDWSKTIKQVRPYIQNDDAFYISFITRKNTINQNELITQIHEYCVYESFRKLGWLFTPTLPKKPRIKYNQKLFLHIIGEKYNQTFNDDEKELFKNMIAIVQQMKDPNLETDFYYGTSRFEYVWESMIDKVFGIEGKDFYFPKTTWILPDGSHDNANLEPDTIMIHNGNIYVIDAKYYKYGITLRPSDLPESTSINKQITYGEYIATQEKFHDLHGKYQVYNAFLIPFAAKSGMPFIKHLGEALSNWKGNQETYERIEGLLIDCKHLMSISSHRDYIEIMRLAQSIQEAIKDKL